MRRFWLHLGFVLPQLIVCAAFMLLNIAASSVERYEQALGQDYSVLIIAKSPISTPQLPHVKALKKVEPDQVLERLKSQLSAANITALKKILPHFYSLSFDQFMSEKEIADAKAKLLKIQGIERAEVFAKTHTKIYHLLQLLKAFCIGASVLIAALCWALFSKQLRIWRFEHSERIYILELFGASFFGRCGFLLRMIAADLAIVYFLLLAAFWRFGEYSFVQSFYERLDAPLPELSAAFELAIICSAAGLASMLAAMLVLRAK